MVDQYALAVKNSGVTIENFPQKIAVLNEKMR